MCLEINRTFHKQGRSLVAKGDILVFKVLNHDEEGVVYTPYQYMDIEFNDDGVFAYDKTKMKRPNKELFSNGDGYILQGIHSYYNKEKALNLYNYLHIYGTHSEVYFAIVPKGSRFFIGNSGDIVSNNLVVFENRTSYLKNREKFGKILSLDRYLFEHWH